MAQTFAPRLPAESRIVARRMLTFLALLLDWWVVGRLIAFAVLANAYGWRP